MLRIRVARDRANSLNVLSRSPRQRSLKGESRLPCQTAYRKIGRFFRNTLSVTFSASFRNLSLVVVYYNFAPYCKNLRENVYAESRRILSFTYLASAIYDQDKMCTADVGNRWGVSSRHASMLRIRVARDRANGLNVLSRSPRQRSLKGESRLPCQTAYRKIGRFFLLLIFYCKEASKSI